MMLRQVSQWNLFLTVIALSCIQVDSAISGYSDSPAQYHIQTDEGPERFFRFQTYNGQYRKERRLEDGSIVGSYGWVDPSGWLRMTDYVADGNGFRVLKSRMEFVGVKPVPEEPESEKKAITPMKHSVKVTGPYEFPFATAVPLRNQNALPDGPRKREFVSSNNNVVIATANPSTTSAVSPFQEVQVPAPAAAAQIQIPAQPSTKRHRQVALPLNTENRPFRRPVKSRIIKVYRRPVNGKFSSTFTTETVPGENGRFARFRPTSSGNGTFESDVFKNYVTPLPRGTGFLYKIPHQYHKEETSRDGTRAGSFGYVDPFGIRRVIHYNAGKDGFEHEKDFEYVGKQY